MKKLFQKINDNKQLRNGIILLTFLLIVAIMAPVLYNGSVVKTKI